ncbi:ATP-grasp domain-containing protein [Streptomyces achromogenes]|uniref:ATP-grasp domain-containing protein n=1 Tax=Streptomyces achromogenes TaxID=67255 RepID=UPI0036F97421
MSSAQTVLFVNTRPSPAEAEPTYAAARALGLDVVLLADHPVPVQHGHVTEHIAVDTFDLPALVEAARDAARRHDVAGVVCWGDRDVEGVAAVADALGLPGNTPEAAARARDKSRTRDALRRHCPDLTPAFARVAGEEDLEQALAEVPLPAVLKPVGASASKGIYSVRTADEARAAHRELRRYTDPANDPIFRRNAGRLLLEERIEGTEHSVEGIVRDGRLEAAAVTDKFVREPFFIEYLQTHPSALPAEIQERVLDAARRTVTALGLGTTAIHLELKVTPDGRPVVLELNSRTGGGYITTHLLRLARGYPFLEQVLTAVCGLGPTLPMPDAHLVAGSQQVISTADGKLTGLRGVDAALNVPGVLHFAQDAPRGTVIAQPPASFTSSVLGSVIARGPSRTGVTEALAEAAALVTAEVE